MYENGNAASNGMEGGDELKDAYELVGMMFRPVAKAKDRVNSHIKKAASSKIKKGTKRNHTKRTVSKTAEKAVKKTAKNATKKAAKEITKKSAKVATTAATTAVGSAGGPAGSAIGWAVGEVAGLEMERRFMKRAQRQRVARFIGNKLGSAEKDNDNVFKMIGSLAWQKIKFKLDYTKYVLPLLALSLIGLMLIMWPVVAAVGVLYNSPLGLLLPKITKDDVPSVEEVVDNYYESFIEEVRAVVADSDGFDSVELVNGEAMERKDTEWDIASIYMVREGQERMAASMDDTDNRNKLKAVFEDMMSYEISTYETRETIYVPVEAPITPAADEEDTEEVEIQFQEEEIILHHKVVTVYIQNAYQMSEIYNFNAEQREQLTQLINKSID